MITWGIEEEVFVIESKVKLRPSLQSLYYLAKLFWRDPLFYYKGSSSNFSRGRDIILGLMSGVEITTGIHRNLYSLLKDFQKRRKELGQACEGLIVPMGHLITGDTPTNVCALQIHIGGVTNEKNYYNLAYFLPLLFLLTASSPLRDRSYYGQSYRLAAGYAIGPPEHQPSYRFQDIIFSRRLGTIEVKIFDPCWDLERIKVLLEALLAIIKIKERLPFNIDEYKRQRWEAARYGYTTGLKELHQKLNDYYPIDRRFFLKTPADEIYYLYKKEGVWATYSALDNAYRQGEFKPHKVREVRINPLKIGAGFLGYYLLRLPYRAWKYWRDWR